MFVPEFCSIDRHIVDLNHLYIHSAHKKMPDLINTAKHLKKNARKAKSFTRKVEKRLNTANNAASLSAGVRPDSNNPSTALVVRTNTSMKTGMSTSTVSKKKLLKQARNAKYLQKTGFGSLAQGTESKGKEGRRKEAIAAAIATDLDDALRYGNGAAAGGDDDAMEQDEVSSTQRKARARAEAARRAKETTKALKQILESSNGISAQAALQGEMEIETSGSGTTLGRPRYVF